jgi:hypothetical protein
VNDVGLCFIAAFAPILLVQLLKLCDLGAEDADLFAKDFEVIHNARIAFRQIVASVANPFAPKPEYLIMNARTIGYEQNIITFR